MDGIGFMALDDIPKNNPTEKTKDTIEKLKQVLKIKPFAPFRFDHYVAPFCGIWGLSEKVTTDDGRNRYSWQNVVTCAVADALVNAGAPMRAENIRLLREIVNRGTDIFGGFSAVAAVFSPKQKVVLARHIQQICDSCFLFDVNGSTRDDAEFTRRLRMIIGGAVAEAATGGKPKTRKRKNEKSKQPRKTNKKYKKL